MPADAHPVATFGERFGLTILGGLLRLALTGKNEGTRLRAFETLADRVFGKRMQRVKDETGE